VEHSKLTLRGIREGFSPVFWVANTLELFERFAFYGSKAVLSYYLVHAMSLPLAAAGWLIAMFAGLIWSLPVVAGVVVDRYGFRRTLLACFATFTVGYFLIGLAGMPAGQPFVHALGKTGYMAAVLVLTAAGGSLIKPCIVGTVERTARDGYRALGFSIYYALVNLGGALGPILASTVRADLGIAFVFVVSAATSALMLASTWIFFREPERQESGPRRSLGALFGDMALVFRNVRFMSFLVVFSGFWVMFWQIFYSFPFYVDEVLHFPRFEVLETVDAWTIIILSVPLTALAKRMTPVTGMTVGFLIASSSWLILAATGTIAGAIATLFLFAVGESLQAPRYYEYVGRLAPRHQVGTYMGFAFLPVAIGAFIAGRLGTWLVEAYMRDTHQPARMWLVTAGIGFASTLLMVLYNRFVARGERNAT
jgi:dipeptide/tripeptide permease